MGSVHVSLQRIRGDRVEERAQRAEASLPNTGYVLEAPYLRVNDGVLARVTEAPRGWWEGLNRWLFGPRPEAPSPPADRRARFALPFDEEGADALGLFGVRVPLVRTGDTPEVGIRRARGRAVAMHSDDGPLFEDLWVESHGWRIAQGHDFALVTEPPSVVIVSCGLAPLIVARPRRLSVAEHHPQWASRLYALHPDPDMGARGWSVCVRQGDEVEVLGVVRPLKDSQRRFQLEGGSGPYRALPTKPNQVLGDEDGTRLVMRVLRATS